MITITGMDDFPTALCSLPFPLLDGRSVIACVHQPTPGTNETAYAACYYVAKDGKATLIGKSDQGKAIAVALEINGTKLTMRVTEPPAGGGGAAAQIDCYDYTLSAAIAAPDYTVRDTVKGLAHSLTVSTDAEIAALETLMAALAPLLPG